MQPKRGLLSRAAPRSSGLLAELPTSGIWEVERLHSSVTFSVVHHQVATFRATFVNLGGEFDGGAQRLTGDVAVADLSLAHIEPLKDRLMAADFLNAEEFPRLSFASTRIRQDGHALAVNGELTLRGVTNPVTAEGVYHPQRTVQSGPHINERFGIDLTTTIDRRDFGVSFNNEIAKGVLNLGWFVKIEAALELVERPG